MIEVTKDDRVELYRDGVRFEPYPLTEGPTGFMRNGYRIRLALDKNCISGQTALNRYDFLIRKSLETLAKYRPGLDKCVGSFPASIGAEAVSLAVRAQSMDLLDEFSIEAVDVQPEYIRVAQRFEFPKGMLCTKPSWLKSAFDEAANNTNWVCVREDIKQAVTIHPPQDLRDFKGEKPFDLMMINNLLVYLKRAEVLDLMKNLLPQSNGLVCMAGRASASGDARFPDYLREVFMDSGFQFADPCSDEIVPFDDAMRVHKHIEADAYIAIHPDLLAEMS